MADVASIPEILGNVLSRSDSAAGWSASEIILPTGYIAVSFDSFGNAGLKIGDGIHTWSGLSFLSSGGGGSSAARVQAISELPENPINGTIYYFKNSNVGRTILFHDGEKWLYSKVGSYPISNTFDPNYILDMATLTDGTPAEAVFIVDREATISDLTFSSAVKIFGNGQNNINYGYEIPLFLPAGSSADIYYEINAEKNCDYGRFFLNDVQYAQVTNIETGVVHINSGMVEDIVLKVTYVTDRSIVAGEDGIFIYGIIITKT